MNVGLIVDGELVSIAGKVRDTGSAASIAGVYTLPQHRGRGYAGKVTAALCDHLRSEGKRTICLFVDLANPFSQRCYKNIGFASVSEALFLPRRC